MLADLFILHHQVAPEPGSPLDIAFEREIIKLFKREFELGMKESDVLKSIEAKLDNSETVVTQRKLNSFNAIGVGAHWFYSNQKAFIYRLKNAALNAGKLKDELHSGDSMSNFEKYEADVEAYQTQIRTSLDEIELHIEQKRDNDVYKNNVKMEHSDRNRYIEETALEFTVPEKFTTKQQAIKARLSELQATDGLESDTAKNAPSSRK